VKEGARAYLPARARDGPPRDSTCSSSPSPPSSEPEDVLPISKLHTMRRRGSEPDMSPHGRSLPGARSMEQHWTTGGGGGGVDAGAGGREAHYQVRIAPL